MFINPQFEILSKTQQVEATQRIWNAFILPFYITNSTIVLYYDNPLQSGYVWH